MSNSQLDQMPVVKLDHVSFSYGKTLALDDFSLEIAPRKLVGLIGPDGVGKSTMLSLVTGARVIQDGDVFVLGGDMRSIDYMLKGLTRCSACGGTLAMSSAVSGKNKTRTMQCCNYSKGSCNVSHSVTIPKVVNALIEGLELAIETKQFNITPKAPKKTDTAPVDYDKLIAIEERKLERAKQAFLAEIDTIEQYANNKKEITERINGLIAKRDKEAPSAEIDRDAYAKKVSEVVEFIKRSDVTEMAKNEALRSIIEKIVYEKAKGNLAISFHEI